MELLLWLFQIGLGISAALFLCTGTPLARSDDAEFRSRGRWCIAFGLGAGAFSALLGLTILA